MKADPAIRHRTIWRTPCRWSCSGSRRSRRLHWVPAAFPLHSRIEDPQDQIEDAVIAEFAFRPPLGHREVGEDKCDELRLGELNGNWRCDGAFYHIAHAEVAS